MAIGLIVVEKQLAGEVWVNTYGCITNGVNTGDLQESDLQLIGALSPLTLNNTNPSDPSYLGGTFLVHAIMGFERRLHWVNAEFVRLYVTDGKKQELPLRGEFVTVDINFNGLRTNTSGQHPAPGSVTLQVNRVPASPGVLRGRAFYRAVLFDEEVGVGSTRLVDFVSIAARTNMEALVNQQITESLLDRYFFGGANADTQQLAIPSYVPQGQPNEGQLSTANVIRNLVVRNVVSRQVKRGRRRSTT